MNTKIKQATATARQRVENELKEPYIKGTDKFNTVASRMFKTYYEQAINILTLREEEDKRTPTYAAQVFKANKNLEVVC